jgi:hypothetical protein
MRHTLLTHKIAHGRKACGATLRIFLGGAPHNRRDRCDPSAAALDQGQAGRNLAGRRLGSSESGTKSEAERDVCDEVLAYQRLDSFT